MWSMKTAGNSLRPAELLVACVERLIRIAFVCLGVQELLTIAHHQAAHIRDDATDIRVAFRAWWQLD
jgi:hypothetical protein